MLFKNNTAAAAKSLQWCPTLYDPIDGTPPGYPRPWDSPGKNTGYSPPGSSVHGISQGRIPEGKVLPFPSPGHLPEPGGEVISSALQVDSLPLSHLGSPLAQRRCC